MAIDYGRMKRSAPRLKGMLTRAMRTPNLAHRYTAVVKACQTAVQEWEAIGAWPDNWSHWQRSLDITVHACNLSRYIRLEEFIPNA